MTPFQINSQLEIGSVFEVTGSSVKLTLDHEITELSKSHGGTVYSVGQIGGLLKLHLGRHVIFATVELLRLQTDEETALIDEGRMSARVSAEKRVIEASLIGEGTWLQDRGEFLFRRGVSRFPLPLQKVHLVTPDETRRLYESINRPEQLDVDSRVTIGRYVGANRVVCKADIDKLLGQHCAILGSTGSGKSSAVAAIIHSILDLKDQGEASSNPRIVLIDPHGEYSSAFVGRAKVFRAYDVLGQGEEGDGVIQMPYWLMSGDEFRSLVIGKTEFEATSQANVIYKALSHSRMVYQGLVQSALKEIPDDIGSNIHIDEPVLNDGIEAEEVSQFDRDRPLPFSLKEFEAHILDRQAKRKKGSKWESVTDTDLQKTFLPIINKLKVLRTDPRIGFLMSEVEENEDSLPSIILQLIGSNDPQEPNLRIIDISGLPNEVAGPLTGAIARLLFQYKQYQSVDERKKDPLLLVCEEAHRYVPDRGEAEYAVAQDAIKRIAREGRKYGLGLMLVSQRPADVEGTVISQCNSWIILRLSNGNDQQHVARFLPDSLAGMTKLLPSLPRQEALFVGEAAAIPARIKLRTLTKDQLPNSDDISFIGGWSTTGNSEEVVSEVIRRIEGRT